MGTDSMFERPDSWPSGPDPAPAGWSKPAVAPRYGDRHDVRYADQERSTSNVQLSTFNGVTGRAHDSRDMGTDTEFGRPDSWPGGPDQASVGPFRPAMAPRYGDRHDVQYADQERLTSNVQLSTFNGLTEKGAW